MGVEHYQKKHLDRWLAAEERKAALDAAFVNAINLYLLVLDRQGTDKESIRRRLAEIKDQNTTKEQKTAFISATDEAMTILLGVKTETIKSAIDTIANGRVNCFRDAMMKFDAMSQVLRRGHQELVQALSTDRRIIYEDPKDLNWQEAMAVFEKHPDLFGIETGTGEGIT